MYNFKEILDDFLSFLLDFSLSLEKMKEKKHPEYTVKIRLYRRPETPEQISIRNHGCLKNPSFLKLLHRKQCKMYTVTIYILNRNHKKRVSVRIINGG